MKKDFTVKLNCEKCKRTNYYTRRNKKTVENKLELKKFCKWCKSHTIHKEGKK
ncbi:50S ribosomal protein L33 [Patescibacteria group bacterium]|nr:50S ribosomal protein L33 [Patescibacteria group bacterium]